MELESAESQCSLLLNKRHKVINLLPWCNIFTSTHLISTNTHNPQSKVATWYWAHNPSIETPYAYYILNRCQIIFDIDSWINEHSLVKQSTTRLILTPIYNSYIFSILFSNFIQENSILAYITSAVQPPKSNLQPIIEHQWKRENITQH